MGIMKPVFSSVFGPTIPDVNWIPNSLFALAEPGVWYDPSDLTTLFQDNLGATPVTAPAQTVGKMLDKSGRGNHATQATLAQRPIYGINPITGTRNLLTRTEEFDNAAWTKTSGGTASVPVVTANAAAAPDGSITADRVQFALNGGTTATDLSSLRQAVNAPVGQNLSFWVKSNDSNSYIIRVSDANGISTTITITPSWGRFSVSAPSGGGATINYGLVLRGGQTPTNSNTADILIWGAQLELGSTATAYQKVVSQYEVTEAGVQSTSYLRFDGVDDSMVTGTITPGTDKVQVFSGVRKISDAARANIVEFGNAALNAWFINGPSGSGSDYYFGSAGSVSTFTRTVKAAPTTDVLTCIGDIANDIAIIRDNGTQVATSTANQGTGNYNALPLYIGRRGGTTFPFNGRIYSLIVRFGANLTAQQIISAETYVNGKTGAY